LLLKLSAILALLTLQYVEPGRCPSCVNCQFSIPCCSLGQVTLASH